jgi:serine/threonine-protein kinase
VLTARHDVPRLLGLSVAQSAKILSADNFTLVVGAKVTSTEKIGNIVSQTPAPGSSLQSGGTITVNLSNGVPTVTLPIGLIGQTCAAATQMLSSVGLNAVCPSTAAVFSARPIDTVVSVANGTIINPSTAAPHATLTLILSKGPSSATGGTTTTTTSPAKGQVRVPNLVGLTSAQVTSALHAAELYYSSDSPSAPWKVVLSQSPPAGTVVAKFSRLRLKVQR